MAYHFSYIYFSDEIHTEEPSALSQRTLDISSIKPSLSPFSSILPTHHNLSASAKDLANISQNLFPYKKSADLSPTTHQLPSSVYHSRHPPSSYTSSYHLVVLFIIITIYPRHPPPPPTSSSSSIVITIRSRHPSSYPTSS